jgi:hypothetical protein
MLNLDAIRSAPVASEPFHFFTVPRVIGSGDLAAIRRDFPAISRPGIFPLSALEYGPAFAALVEAVRAPELRRLMEEKFAVDLEGLPQMITVRGQAQRKDGRIHADSTDKVVTCLLYLNDTWDAGGGRLRLLRGPDTLEDYVAEIPPHGGSFAAFKVAPNSWHGHAPHVGERRYVMVNWLRSEDALKHQLGRHRVSAAAKRLFPFFYRGY